MQESTAYNRILNIINADCGLTLEQYHFLIGVLSVNAGKIAGKILSEQKNKPHRNPSHNPNITMINCSSK